MTYSTSPLLEVRGLEKEFSRTKVLKGIDLAFRKGEVHGLLGENGAGKSTLIKILTGVYSASAGEILIDGVPVHIHSPLDAHRAGLGAVYQDVELVASFTVGQNILLGNEHGMFLSQPSIHDEARAILAQAGIEIDVFRKASTLGAAEMQLVTLGTLLHRKYKLIILDEPTARLSMTEVELLFQIIERFKAQGITIIYISHRLNEVKRVCDRVTILRGGLVSATLEKEEIDEDRVTELMVDRSRSDLETYNEGHSRDRILLELNGLTTAKLKPLNLHVKAGEVIGIMGPVGGGMEQVQLALGGIAMHGGEVRINGKKTTLNSPSAARRAGVALIPEDRRKQALFPNLTVAENICLPVLDLLARFGLVTHGRELAYATQVMNQLAVNPRQPDKAVKFFSGGNQQKAVIGKWLKAAADVYIFVEPTSGVDVGAIKEIYDIILHLAKTGAAILVISSSAREIIALAERVIVIRGGECVFEAPKKECSHDRLLAISLKTRPEAVAA